MGRFQISRDFARGISQRWAIDVVKVLTLTASKGHAKRGYSMKTLKFAVVAGACFVMLNSASVFAQTDTGGSMAMGAPTAKSMRVANRQLAKKVRKALVAAKPAIPTEEIVVLAKKGAVSLVGQVETQDQSDRAAKLAQGVAGVVSVNNQLGLAEKGE